MFFGFACSGGSGSGSADQGQPDALLPADAAAPPAALDARWVQIPDAQSPKPEGCVDIWADETIFEGGSKYFVFDGVWPQTKFHVNAYGVHFAARLVERGPAGETFTGPGQRGDLGIATFDPSTGRVRLARRLDIFGPGTFSNNGGDVKGFATAPDGTFAVLFAQHDPVTAAPTWMILLGRVDGGETRLVPLPWHQRASVHDLAWDGETYVAHGVGIGDTHWGMSRIRTDGTIVAGAERLAGNLVGGREDSDTYITDTVSGRTYYADYDGTPTLCIHERDGSPVAGLPEGCQYADSYFPGNPGARGAISLGGSTPWLWTVVDSRTASGQLGQTVTYLRRLEEPMPTGGSAISVPLESPDQSRGGSEFLGIDVVFGESSASTPSAAYLGEYGYGLLNPAEPRERSIFLRDRWRTCNAFHFDAEGCDGSRVDRSRDAANWERVPVVHFFDGETWFGLRDSVYQPNDLADYGTGIVYHIMKLAPGCEYVSVAQSIKDRLGRPENR